MLILCLYFSWKDLTSWNPSCSSRVSPMDPNLSTWCLTPCWHTTLGTPGWIKRLVELIAWGPMSLTASSSPLKQAITGPHCSWNYIIGITEECSSPWKLSQHKPVFRWCQIKVVLRLPADPHVNPPVSRWSSTTWGSCSSSTGSSWCKTSCRCRWRRRRAVLSLASAGPVTTALTRARPAPAPPGPSCQRRSRAAW